MADRTRHRPLHPARRRGGALPDDAAALRRLRRRGNRLAGPGLPGRLHRPEPPGLDAGQDLRPAPAPAPAVLRPPARRRPDEPGDQRRGHPQPALLAGPHPATRVALQPDRDRGGDALPELEPRAGVLHDHPDHAAPDLVLRPPRPARLPADARDGRGRDSRAAGGDHRRARGPGVQPDRGEHRPLQAAQRGQPRRQRPGGGDHLGLLPGHRRALDAGDRARHRLRRLPGLRRLALGRRADGVPDLRPAVLPARSNSPPRSTPRPRPPSPAPSASTTSWTKSPSPRTRRKRHEARCLPEAASTSST